MLAYDRRWLGRDVAAGLVVVIALPVGIVYAALIGLPAEIGVNSPAQPVEKREHGTRELTGESQPGRLRTPGREMDPLHHIRPLPQSRADPARARHDRLVLAQ